MKDIKKMQRIPAWTPSEYEPVRLGVSGEYLSTFTTKKCVECKEHRNMPRFNTKCLMCCVDQAYGRSA